MAGFVVRALCRNQSKSANTGTSLSSKNRTKPMPPEGGPSVYMTRRLAQGWKSLDARKHH